VQEEAEPAARESALPAARESAAAAPESGTAPGGFVSPGASWAVGAWTRPPPQGPVFPHERVDYTTARHVPRSSVTVGSRKSAFSPPAGAAAGSRLSFPPPADGERPADSDAQLGAAPEDPRQARIHASLAQFKLTARPTGAAAADKSAASGPAPAAGEPLGIGFIPPPGRARSSASQSPGALHRSARGAATTPGWSAGTDFWTSTGAATAAAAADPDPGPAAGLRPSSMPGSISEASSLGLSRTSSPAAAVSSWQSRAQTKAADKDSYDLYTKALQNMNLAQYDERRRERDSKMQQLQAQMQQSKQNQDAEAQRGRAAESQKVQMLENASKQAKREYDERMAERQRLRRAQAEEEAEEEAQRRRKAEEELKLSQQEEDRDGDDGLSDEIDDDADDDSDIHDMDEDDDSQYDDEEEDEEEDAGEDQGAGYPTITNEQKARAQEVMNGGEHGEIIQSKLMGNPAAEINISRRDLQCLQPSEWLNDEVINVWMDYVKDRNERLNDETAGCMPSVYIMKTLFYSRMCVIEGAAGRQDTFDYPGVRRWTKKVDVFAHDMIFIPLHQGMHWALAVVNMRAKKIQYFDSMGGHPNKWYERHCFLSLSLSLSLSLRNASDLKRSAGWATSRDGWKRNRSIRKKKRLTSLVGRCSVQKTVRSNTTASTAGCVLRSLIRFVVACVN
jgi:hypothetical protein